MLRLRLLSYYIRFSYTFRGVTRIDIDEGCYCHKRRARVITDAPQMLDKPGQQCKKAAVLKVKIITIIGFLASNVLICTADEGLYFLCAIKCR